MDVSSARGGNVSLSKEAPGLSAVLVGLGGTSTPRPVPTTTSTRAH